MTGFLIFLLVVALTAIGFLGFHAFQLHIQIARLDSELEAQESQLEKEIRDRNDLAAASKARIELVGRKYIEDTKLWNEQANARFKAELEAHQIQLKNEIKNRDELAAASKARVQAIAQRYNEDAKKWNEHAAVMKAEVQRLSKWKHIADADTKAAEMLQQARETLERANEDARNLISMAQQQASKIQIEAQEKAATELTSAKELASSVTSEAKEKSKSQREEAYCTLTSAIFQANNVIQAADKKAAEIAGAPYEAMKNAALYEQTVRAMKNIIEGYGDQYIISEQSLLDDLAEDFSHTQAGQALKRAREFTKLMMKNGTSALCEYAEANRRDTAINFVADAFNGKVDSILSRVKHDNAGKLKQEILDAFALVNFNGKAFRDARITEHFLAARLDELKWAAIAQQLALQERDEQRSVKEQAREEARAAKERERALREAGKEEEILRKAMEQAQEQFEQASGEQKAKYEERLREMAEKLNQALERKDRARSMAQQTAKGHVYIISNIGSFGDSVHKIGLTRRLDPRDRIDELGGASVPFGFDVHATILSDNAPELEHKLHKHFVLSRMNKVNHRKEFFRVSLKQIREEIETLGLTGVNWTMTADAKEYRETIATEKKMSDDPTMREAWIKRQADLERRFENVLETIGGDEEEE